MQNKKSIRVKIAQFPSQSGSFLEQSGSKPPTVGWLTIVLCPMDNVEKICACSTPEKLSCRWSISLLLCWAICITFFGIILRNAKLICAFAKFGCIVLKFHKVLAADWSGRTFWSTCESWFGRIGVPAVVHWFSWCTRNIRAVHARCWRTRDD